MCSAGTAAADDPPTFASDIAPLLYANCVQCHQPGGDAPFSLTTYADARRRAVQIARVTASRYMPPWKPEPDAGEFLGARRLTDGAIHLFEAWAAAGAPEGDAATLPALPRQEDGWRAGAPDLILRLPPYTLRADGPDVFRNFVVPVPLAAARYVRWLQFRPQNRGVHHANIRLDRTRASRQLDASDPEAGYEGVILHSADYPDGHFLGWTPGQAPPLGSPDLAWRLEPNTDLVIQLHMQPTGKPETIEALVGLYFSSDAPARTPSIVRLGRQNLDIPAAARDYRVRDEFVLPVDAQVHAIQPHAHYRARTVRAWATLPDGSERPLLHIADWDMNWQDQYRYAQPFWLPAGTTLRMEYSFDNSRDNPRNPDADPARVSWGWRSIDEMADVWIQVIARSDADRVQLNTAARRKMVAEDAIGSEVLIARQPNHVNVRNDAALIYMELGRPLDALRHFAAVTRLEPQSATAWYNEGVALEAAGRIRDAADRYQHAVRLDPQYASAHNNLGNALAALGDITAATTHYRKAIAADPANAEARNNLAGFLVASSPSEAVTHLRAALEQLPEYPEAHFNLARALTLLGQPAAAVQEYQAALTLRPEWTPALINLSWLLSAHRDDAIRRPQLAVTVAERAVALTGRKEAGALDAMASAYASAGRFEEAARAARDAIALADAAHQQALVEKIRDRLALYRRHQPFVVAE